MSTPYTHEEVDELFDKMLVSALKGGEYIYEIDEKRLHPYCLIGLPLSEARKKMEEWAEYNNPGGGRNVEILVAGKQICFGQMWKTSYFCNIDENNIMTDVWPVTEKRKTEN